MITVNNFEELAKAVENIHSPDVSFVDNGIGAYEYGGARGIDRRMEWEIEGDTTKIQINFYDEDINYVVKDMAYERSNDLWDEMNRGRDEDFDYSDVVRLVCKFNGSNVITFEWEAA